LETGDEFAHRIVPALELQRHDRTEAALLALRQLVAGMVLEARVPHAPDIRLSVQPQSERRGVAGVMLEARVQRAQAAQRQEAVERRAGEAQAIGPPHELLVQRGLPGHHGSADHITVTIQVFRGRVHNQIRAERERLLPGGRKKGVVHCDERSAVMRELRDGGDVGDAQQRIARRLDPHQRRRPRQCPTHACLIAEVDELHLPFAAAVPGVEQPVRAAVAVVGHDDAGARGHEVAYDGNRCHAARRHDRAAPLLELRERTGQQVAGRVARARVVVRTLLAEGTEGKR